MTDWLQMLAARENNIAPTGAIRDESNCKSAAIRHYVKMHISYCKDTDFFCLLLRGVSKKTR